MLILSALLYLFFFFSLLFILAVYPLCQRGQAVSMIWIKLVLPFYRQNSGCCYPNG